MSVFITLAKKKMKRWECVRAISKETAYKYDGGGKERYI